MNITVSESAVNQIREIMTGQNLTDHYLRIGVSGDPCSGLEYFLAFDDKIDDTDNKFEFSGMTVLVDGDSAIYLDGASLDYSSDKDKGFIFINPVAENSCGCHGGSCCC